MHSRYVVIGYTDGGVGTGMVVLRMFKSGYRLKT